MKQWTQREITLFCVRIAMLSALGVALMYLPKIPYPPAPFLKFDFADIPVIIGALAMGPWCGVLVAFIKCALYLPVSIGNTFGIGVLSNFICASTFAITAGYIYKIKKTFKTAIIALVAGIIATVIIAIISNWFIVFPVYSFAYGFNLKAKYTTAIIWTGIVPFNLIKSGACAIVVLPIYKVLSKYVFKGNTMFGIGKKKNIPESEKEQGIQENANAAGKTE